MMHLSLNTWEFLSFSFFGKTPFDKDTCMTAADFMKWTK